MNITSYFHLLIFTDKVEGHITNDKYLDANQATKTFLIHDKIKYGGPDTSEEIHAGHFISCNIMNR